MKSIFVKSDKVGDGELGSILMKGFLNAVGEQKELPESIIFVNSAVLLTTADADAEITLVLKKLEDMGGGKFKVIYSIDENSMCPKNYIKKNDMLEIEVDLVSGSTSSKWISNPTLKEDSINSLYPKKGNCKYLAGYVYQFIEQLKEV